MQHNISEEKTGCFKDWAFALYKNKILPRTTQDTQDVESMLVKRLVQPKRLKRPPGPTVRFCICRVCSCVLLCVNRDNVETLNMLNLFTTIHDGNFRRHSSMNVTIKWHKFSSNIYYIYVFFVIWSWKLR